MNHAIKFGSGIGVVGLLAVVAALTFGISGPGQSEATPANPDQKASHDLSVLEPVQPSDLRGFGEEADFRIGLTIDRFGEDSNTVVDSLAQVNAADGSRITIYGVDQAVCFYKEMGAGTCGNDESLLDEGLFVSSPTGCSGWEILGLAPDRVTKITTTDPEGVSKSWPVSSNVYLAKVGHDDVDVQGFDESGQKLVDFPVDISWMDKGMTGCSPVQ
ncbi:MAG TPA: hypothetical protein VMF31_03400 [Solirubrobacterales bacterium]|nr:hypothetical protein [Solirubrobacterales bacterium]